MRVCFFSHSAELGGAERTLVEVLEGLSARGVSCHVWVPERGALSDHLETLNIQTHYAPYRLWMSKNRSFHKQLICLVKNLILLPYLAWLSYRRGADIIYTSSITLPVGALTARLLGKPHIWHIHEFGLADHGLRFDWGETRSWKLIGNGSTSVIATSEAVAAMLRTHVSVEKIVVVPCGFKLPEKLYSLANIPGRRKLLGDRARAFAVETYTTERFTERIFAVVSAAQSSR